MSEERTNKEIELRSEKVRNIVGKVPPRLLRIGISVISLVLVCVLVLAYIIPYPQYKIFDIQMYSAPMVQTVKAPVQGGIELKTQENYVQKEQIVCVLKTKTDSVISFKTDVHGKLFLNCNNGEIVNKNDILFSVIPDSITSFYGIIYVPANEVKHIKNGQKATVSFSEKTLTGYVSAVYPIPATVQGTTKPSYKVKILFSMQDYSVQEALFLANTLNDVKLFISDKPILKSVLFEVTRTDSK